MSDITAIRQAIADSLTDVDVNVTAVMTPLVNVPAVMVRPDRAEYADKIVGGTGGSMDRLTFRLHVIVSRVEDDNGQALLDQLLPQIKAAVEADRKLGGTVDRCRVSAWESYGFVTWFDQQIYLGAETVIECICPPS